MAGYTTGFLEWEVVNVFSDAKVEDETMRSAFCNDEELENFFMDKEDNFPKELKDLDFEDNEKVEELLPEDTDLWPWGVAV